MISHQVMYDFSYIQFGYFWNDQMTYQTEQDAKYLRLTAGVLALALPEVEIGRSLAGGR